MSKYTRRPLAGLAAAAVGLTGAVVATGAPVVAHAAECTPAKTVNVFTFNDFHGRVEGAAKLFTPVEQQRQAAGEDNVLVLSNGDNIGGSTFVSAVSDDKPTLDVLNAIDLDVSTAGNHEFDKGWKDLSGRVVADSNFDYLAANIVNKGTKTVAAPLKPYEIFDKGGVKIAVVGAVTKDLPALVSPAGIDQLDVLDPVKAVNEVAKQLKDGQAGNGEADIVIASIHEGSPNTAADAATAAEAAGFGAMFNDMDASVDMIVNGHTHQPYISNTVKGQPIVQAKSYAEQLVRLDLDIAADGKLCAVTPEHVAPANEPDSSLPRIQEIEKTVAAAVAVAKDKGAKVVGNATEAISTPGEGGSGTRDEESPMSNMVAQMFYDQLNGGNDEFIGVQNPGGTRTSFNKGEITYEEAALVLPFANSLMTTELTGEQFVEVLNQQWQRDKDGNVPSRPYLALGLSKNVSYTYDESLPEGERITAVYINGKPMDMQKRYTVGSGSFLISGGDNFRAFSKGVNSSDTGHVDLTTWVDWISKQKDLAPDYTKRGVAVTGVADVYKAGEEGTITLGAPGQVYKGTLDMMLGEGEKVSPKLANTQVTAYLGDTEVGSGTVTDGTAQISIKIPADAAGGMQTLRFVVKDSGTEVLYPINIEGVPGDSKEPGKPGTPEPGKPGTPEPGKPGLPSTGV